VCACSGILRGFAGEAVRVVHIVWFKRDLRVLDHRPLALAAHSGEPVVCLYIHEPEILSSPEFNRSHAGFIEESLDDLDRSLRLRGTRLTVRVGEVTRVLDGLSRAVGEHRGRIRLWSHEETGNRVTFDRDIRVGRWADARGVLWTEIPQNGVVRRLGSRDGWSRWWARRMNEPVASAPDRVTCARTFDPAWDFGLRPRADELGVRGEDKPHRQRGGEREASEVLRSFLYERGVNYRADMASPVTGARGCSRLSPHLAWGTISVRTVHHALRARQRELRGGASAERDRRWRKSLMSFQGRLRWHCHFIQKLESEPDIEFRNMNRAYDGLRTENTRDWTKTERTRFKAWCTGRTGYPFVDACMRSLHQTGWLNFRMRSMLVSFASYHLWLHWRPTAVFLAGHFLDFEPGIHFSQFQMQSGVTGINTVRIYNPVKQSMDQDPDGVFIRTWVPELADVPDPFIHEPWKYAAEGDSLFAGVETPGVGTGYPNPIVDHAAAYRAAQERIFSVRRSPTARAEARRVYLAHGSRRSPRDQVYRGGPEDRGTA
jgi:deoxyribodipyrimidine photo-lyase